MDGRLESARLVAPQDSVSWTKKRQKINQKQVETFIIRRNISCRERRLKKTRESNENKDVKFKGIAKVNEKKSLKQTWRKLGKASQR